MAFSLGNATMSQIVSAQSFIPRFTAGGGMLIPNIAINNSFLTSFAMPPIHQIMPLLPSHHCKLQFNLDLDMGPAIAYKFDRKDPMELRVLKSTHNMMMEYVPHRPFDLKIQQNKMTEIRDKIDSFCIKNIKPTM